MSRKQRGYTIVRVAVGALLLVAAALKGFELSTHGLPPLVGAVHERWFLTLVVEAELALGVILLAGVLKRTAWAIAILYFLAFISFTAFEAWHGKTSCGCFGGIKSPPIFTFGLDLAVLASLAIWRPELATNQRKQLEWPGMSTALGVILIGLAGAKLMMAAPWIQKPRDNGEPAERETFAVLEPAKWVGQQFWLSKHIDVGRELKGKWIVVLYNHSCPRCQAELPAYKQTAAKLSHQPGAPRIALVEIPPYDPASAPDPKNPWLAGKLTARYDWFAKTPVELLVEDGVVKFAKEAGDGLSWWRDEIARTEQ